ncbi:4Fe-4S binding protein [Marispirochaeta aestuarii]|uniref:4Fe-4S binding protein n=1 Tax=Marispirochaeta aestuarii TaxID=1963862 RepID=UPI0029C85C1D|nr:4Fe-4S binding protein [Marispirochaeta aestuarii]
MQTVTDKTVRPAQFYLKTERTFTGIRKYSWVLVPIVAFGSLYYPLLGLFVFAIMLVIMGSGFFQGRYWCGNLCPHGSLFDKVSMSASRFIKIPRIFKSPVTRWVFFAIYMFMFFVRLARVMPLWGNPEFMGKFGMLMGKQYLVMPTVLGFALSMLNPRSWCSFCPMGSLGHVFYKLGKVTKLNHGIDKKVTIASTDKCHKCATCARVCPVQLSPFQNFDGNNQFNNELCIRCGTCVANCPANQLQLATATEADYLKQTTVLDGYERRTPVRAVIEKIEQISPSVREFTFRMDADRNTGRKIEYAPGQFVLIKVSDEPEMYRAYSISSRTPDDPDRLSVTVQKKEGGYASDIVFRDFTEGMQVQLEGPMGRDLVVDKKADKVLFIGGGIGITPFVPIVKDISENPGRITKAVLLYGVNREGDFLYDSFFEDAGKRSDVFEYVRTVAWPGEDWKGNTGFVTESLKNMDLKGWKIYMCGPPPMVKAVLRTLEEMQAEGRGVEEQNIYYESA